jgi:predicted membrane metal-binding protein
MQARVHLGVSSARSRKITNTPGNGRRPPLSDNVTERSGWITFAGVAALVAGGYNALSGIAALADDDTIAAQASEVLYGIDLTAWGWFWLIVGVVQLITGVLILQRNSAGLWLGISIASLSALMTVIVMFVFPLWAIAVLAVDFLVLYGLVTRIDEFTG